MNFTPPPAPGKPWWPGSGVMVSADRETRLRYRHRDIIAACAFGAIVIAAWWLLVPSVNPHNAAQILTVLPPAVVAIGIARTSPGASIALVWVSCLIQVPLITTFTPVQLAALYVAYIAARYGSKASFIASGVSVIAGSVFGTAYLQLLSIWTPADNYGGIFRFVESMVVLLALIAVIGAPWTIGVYKRISDQRNVADERSRQAWKDARQAEEVARLRAENANLARDVHDIVGHSLAVIIAQADSIEFIDDTDVSRIREATANIAVTARRSLMSIQNVLSRTSDMTGDVSEHEVRVAELIESINGVGRRLEREDRGTARHVPPRVATVAYSVMREMLTNALRHAAPTSTIRLSRAWTYRTYTVTVENEFDPELETSETGRGIPGMRDRVAAIGGTLHVDAINEDDEPSRFTVSAVLPLDGPDRLPDELDLEETHDAD